MREVDFLRARLERVERERDDARGMLSDLYAERERLLDVDAETINELADATMRVAALETALREVRKLAAEELDAPELTVNAWRALERAEAIIDRALLSAAPAEPVDAQGEGEVTDTARLDWLERAGTAGFQLLCWNVDDKPNNGWTMSLPESEKMNDAGEGDTARQTIDRAMAHYPVPAPTASEGSAE